MYKQDKKTRGAPTTKGRRVDRVPCCLWSRPQAESVVGPTSGGKGNGPKTGASPCIHDRGCINVQLETCIFPKPARKARVASLDPMGLRMVEAAGRERSQPTRRRQVWWDTTQPIRPVFLQTARVCQTRRCMGFPGPMGTWCNWPRPQAGSVLKQVAILSCLIF